jgi:spore coat polysaccharide biosynthesis protein SpsF (cytidylyltransferase family)
MADAAIIIQARMGSTRLPGKSLMEISGKPLIWHVVERAKKSKASKVLLATTTEEKDDSLAEFAGKNGIPLFRGDLDDVLDRYYQAAKTTGAKIIVRITGDSPLVDPQLIDLAIRKLESGGFDYVSNGKQPWMDGFDVEAFTFAALERAWKEAKMASEREHVTPYMKNSGKFKLFYFENDPRLDGVQCSVDRENDLKLVREIYFRMLAKGLDHDFTYKDVIALFESEPALLKINSGSVVNEGYAKSVREDRKVK